MRIPNDRLRGAVVFLLAWLPVLQARAHTLAVSTSSSSSSRSSVTVTKTVETAFSSASSTSQPAFEDLTAEERQQFCDANYDDLYANMGFELRRWNETGISLELMQATIKAHTLRSSGSSRKGFVAGFRGGRAVLPDKPRLTKDLAHHTALFFLYMQSLVDLEKLFGDLIPDVDFVISTIDRPLGMVYESSSTVPQPVMRFCKSPSHSDILIPIFHFLMKGHGSDLGGMSEEINDNHPWATRRPTLFGRFSLYERHMHPNDPYTKKMGENRSEICRGFTGSVVSCTVRSHFIDYTKQFPKSRLDVATMPRITMLDHAYFKYLVHMDGQGLSSRLDQLLSLGSLIFKEESGYYAFYHHLLKPYEHYVPFWKEVPEEILPALEWARTHDREAEEMGRAAQRLATKYLSREARACYWFKLLREYAKLLRYVPAEQSERKYMKYQVPVSEYLNTEAATWEDGAQLRRYPFSP